MITTLIEKWSHLLDKAFLPTWTGRGEMAYIAEQASHASQAAEFGSYMGASAWIMLKANPNLHLWVCDPFMVFGTDWVVKHFLAAEIAEGRCEVIKKYSREASDQLSHVRGKLDYVFIDDGHAKEDVVLDIECWKPLVRPGGILFGHDYEPPNEVAQAVQENLPGHYMPCNNMWAFIVPPPPNA